MKYFLTRETKFILTKKKLYMFFGITHTPTLNRYKYDELIKKDQHRYLATIEVL